MKKRLKMILEDNTKSPIKTRLTSRNTFCPFSTRTSQKFDNNLLRSSKNSPLMTPK